MREIPKFPNENILVGFDSSDDACIYKINDDIALVQTVDFFPPMVDDPYLFGQIAAANSISDIYAMGGTPTHALNLLCFPNCLDLSVAGEILAGGADKAMEANCTIAGGHSITDNEPKYGMCVSGIVDPKKILANDTAREGDLLVMTKALGTGILTTAFKGELISEQELKPATDAMKELNRAGAEAARGLEIHACTDITGFGMGGHLCEIAEGSGTHGHVPRRNVSQPRLLRQPHGSECRGRRAGRSHHGSPDLRRSAVLGFRARRAGADETPFRCRCNRRAGRRDVCFRRGTHPSKITHEVTDMASKLLLRQIPKTDSLLSRPAIRDAQERYPYAFVKATVQDCLDELREEALAGRIDRIPTPDELETSILGRLERGHLFRMKRVINATGVVLHTNLGRAPLGEDAAMHIAELSKGYCNLEYDTQTGSRGSRYALVEQLLCELTGAEAAMVVNNNAGAVFLMLNTLAKGKTVAVSRGELVEIGGSFRVPEIMYASGAQMCEIGCTNKTHVRDYERAMDEQGAEVLLKVYTSNFVINGFTESVSAGELARIAHERGGLVLHDQGSGFLFPPEAMGMHAGNVAWASLREDVDVVSFSGDKLLGSAQCGIILGKKQYIDRIKKNQLTRMLRIDKLSLAALEICLQYCRDPKLAREKLPALRMLSCSETECRETARTLCRMITQAAPTCDARVISVRDEAGGGSMAGVLLDGAAVAVNIPDLPPEKAETLLHRRDLPIIARVSRDGVLFSARTLFEEDLEAIADAVRELCEYAAGRRT